MRECPRCKTMRQDIDFPKCRSPKGRADGSYSHCKPCTRQKASDGLKKPPKRTAPDGMKWCATCKKDRPKTDFFSLRAAYDGLQKRCKECSYAAFNKWRPKKLADHATYFRDHINKSLYKMPRGMYEAMAEQQHGRCAICEETSPPENKSKRRWLHVDHCHDTGVIRGLLCSRCNTGIGQLRHDPKVLQSAIHYLSQFL